MTQCDKVLAMLRSAGSSGITSLDIVQQAHVLNTTGRISDLRAKGYTIECFKEGGLDRYRLIDPLMQNMKERDRLAQTEPGKQQSPELIPRPTGYGVP